ACGKVAVNTRQQYYYIHHQGTISSRSFSNHDLDTIKVWRNNEVACSGIYFQRLYQRATRGFVGLTFGA
ncbi:hypothetical protein AAULR_23906, partial [Lacticaseibacillus rhamnosus MTCC 5462]